MKESRAACNRLEAAGLLQTGMIPPQLMAALWGYTVVGMGILKYVMPDYRALVQAQNELEGKFKFEHARVRLCSESIAFFGGHRREQALLNKRYEQVAALKVSEEGRQGCNTNRVTALLRPL